MRGIIESGSRSTSAAAGAPAYPRNQRLDSCRVWLPFGIPFNVLTCPLVSSPARSRGRPREGAKALRINVFTCGDAYSDGGLYECGDCASSPFRDRPVQPLLHLSKSAQHGWSEGITASAAATGAPSLLRLPASLLHSQDLNSSESQ